MVEMILKSYFLLVLEVDKFKIKFLVNLDVGIGIVIVIFSVEFMVF